MLLREAAAKFGWNLNYGGIALMWRGGCIIRRCVRESVGGSGVVRRCSQEMSMHKKGCYGVNEIMYTVCVCFI